MARKTVGYVKLVWTCPRCGTRNPGPNRFCTGCGAPQPHDVQFEQPAEAELLQSAEEIARAQAGADVNCPYCGSRNPHAARFCGACGGDLASAEARESGRVVGAYRAPSDARQPCPSCGTPNPLTRTTCSNCGAALPASRAAAPAAAPTPRRTPVIGLVGGGILAAACLVTVVAFAALSLKRSDQVGQVSRVAWERTVRIEGLVPVEHQTWQDELPGEASDVSCSPAYRETRSEPAPQSTEVCGTPYTVDTGTGLGEVVQDCEYRVYDQQCTYTVPEWTVVDAVSAQGVDLAPTWPEIALEEDQRQGEQVEAYTVFFSVDGRERTYAPDTAADFLQFSPGSTWVIHVNGLGAIVGLEPSP